MLANSLTLPWVYLVIYQIIKQTICVSYFTEMGFGSFGNGPVNKIIHYVLAILLGLLWDHSTTIQFKKTDTVC